MMLPRSVLLRRWLLGVSSVLLSGGAPLHADEPTEKALAALSRPVQLHAIDEPLLDVINHLAKQARVPIKIAEEELSFIFADAEREQVSCTLQDAPLQTALRVILANLELTWRIDRGVLLITTEEDAAAHLETEYFEVIDLVAEHPAERPDVFDYDVVDELIRV